MRIAFLEPLEERLREFPARYFPGHEVLTTTDEGQLPEGVETAEAVVWSSWPLDARLIDSMPRLRFMQRIGWFRANGDASAALARGIPVAVTPFGVSDRVAQHALTHTLSLIRQMPQSYEGVLRGDNPDELPEEVTGSSATKINWARVPNLASLNDKTVGILGFGEIGACNARLLAPFCCRTLAYRRRGLTPAQEAFYGVAAASLDEILMESDVVVSFVPYSESSRLMLGAREFGRMKKSAYFVNCGRGNTVDEAALIEALRAGEIAGAGLDVFSIEPLPAASPLKELKNVSLTPHSAGGTPGWMDTFARIAANVKRVEAGEPVVIAMKAGDYQPG